MIGKMTRYVFGLLLVTGLSAVHAQVRVTKSAGEKSTIDLSGLEVTGAGGQLFYQTLERDLLRSGWFTPVRGAGEFRILGSATADGRDVKAEVRVYRTGDQRSMMGKAYREQVANADRLAHRAADDIVEALTGHKGMASTRLAMVGTLSGKKEVYLSDADGGHMLQLTRDNSVSIAPKWGPLGDKLIYTSFLKKFPDVYLIDVASGSRDRIANYPGLNTGADISPNGQDVALILSKDGNPELYVKNLASGQLTRLTRSVRAAEASPSWSPDGSQIVYVSDQSGRPQLYTISRSGGQPRRLTTRGTENVSPDWGANGKIAYAGKFGPQYQICVIDPRTGEINQITRESADYEDPSWAPDGRHIAATRTQNYRSSIYILDTMGDRPVPLMRFEIKGDWFSPAWSPK